MSATRTELEALISKLIEEALEQPLKDAESIKLDIPSFMTKDIASLKKVLKECEKIVNEEETKRAIKVKEKENRTKGKHQDEEKPKGKDATVKPAPKDESGPTVGDNSESKPKKDPETKKPAAPGAKEPAAKPKKPEDKAATETGKKPEPKGNAETKKPEDKANPKTPAPPKKSPEDKVKPKKGEDSEKPPKEVKEPGKKPTDKVGAKPDKPGAKESDDKEKPTPKKPPTDSGPAKKPTGKDKDEAKGAATTGDKKPPTGKKPDEKPAPGKKEPASKPEPKDPAKKPAPTKGTAADDKKPGDKAKTVKNGKEEPKDTKKLTGSQSVAKIAAEKAQTPAIAPEQQSTKQTEDEPIAHETEPPAPQKPSSEQAQEDQQGEEPTDKISEQAEEPARDGTESISAEQKEDDLQVDDKDDPKAEDAPAEETQSEPQDEETPAETDEANPEPTGEASDQEAEQKSQAAVSDAAEDNEPEHHTSSPASKQSSRKESESEPETTQMGAGANHVVTAPLESLEGTETKSSETVEATKQTTEPPNETVLTSGQQSTQVHEPAILKETAPQTNGKHIDIDEHSDGLKSGQSAQESQEKVSKMTELEVTNPALETAEVAVSEPHTSNHETPAPIETSVPEESPAPAPTDTTPPKDLPQENTQTQPEEKEPEQSQPQTSTPAEQQSSTGPAEEHTTSEEVTRGETALTVAQNHPELDKSVSAEDFTRDLQDKERPPNEGIDLSLEKGATNPAVVEEPQHADIEALLDHDSDNPHADEQQAEGLADQAIIEGDGPDQQDDGEASGSLQLSDVDGELDLAGDDEPAKPSEALEPLGYDVNADHQLKDVLQYLPKFMSSEQEILDYAFSSRATAKATLRYYVQLNNQTVEAMKVSNTKSAKMFAKDIKAGYPEYKATDMVMSIVGLLEPTYGEFPKLFSKFERDGNAPTADFLHMLYVLFFDETPSATFEASKLVDVVPQFIEKIKRETFQTWVNTFKFSISKRMFIEKLLSKDKSTFNAQSPAINALGKIAGFIRVLMEEVIFYNACIESKSYSKKFTNYVHIYFHNEEKIAYLQQQNAELEELIKLL